MAKSNTIILLGIAGVGYYGYTQGWFNSLLTSFSGTTATPKPATLTPAQAAAAAIAAANMSTAPPPAVYTYNPVGTTASVLPTPTSTAAIPVNTPANTEADVSNQAAQRLPYIIPNASIVSVVPNGYTTVNTLDKGTIFLRNDLYATVFAQDIQVASPLANITLATIRSEAGGLSGLGDYQRHMYSRTGRMRPVRVA